MREIPNGLMNDELLSHSPLLCFFAPACRGFLSAICASVVPPAQCPCYISRKQSDHYFLARGGAANWESL